MRKFNNAEGKEKEILEDKFLADLRNDRIVKVGSLQKANSAEHAFTGRNKTRFRKTWNDFLELVIDEMHKADSTAAIIGANAITLKQHAKKAGFSIEVMETTANVMLQLKDGKLPGYEGKKLKMAANEKEFKKLSEEGELAAFRDGETVILNKATRELVRDTVRKKHKISEGEDAVTNTELGQAADATFTSLDHSLNKMGIWTDAAGNKHFRPRTKRRILATRSSPQRLHAPNYRERKNQNGKCGD